MKSFSKNKQKTTLWFRIFCLIEKLFSKCGINLRNLISINFLENNNNYQFFLGMRTQSEVLQDIFALCIDEISNLKSYLEIGAGDPIEGNNTLILEQNNWTGISIELDKTLVEEFAKKRYNHIICGDATKLDYEKLLDRYFAEKEIAFLQIDIDPAEQSLLVLTKIPFHIYKFACIVFEHDKYRNGTYIRNMQRQILHNLGYLLLAADVKSNKLFEFEDWWINPKLIPISKISHFKSKSIHPCQMNWKSF